MKRRYKKYVAGLLAGVLAGLEAFPAVVLAGPASVDVDEAMYVNLDYYGQISQACVVKGCSLNGLREFTDYGTYQNVENMSTSDVPVIQGDQVQWKLSNPDSERFYYQCEMDASQIQLPWTFDLSYKLNGVPADGEDLAGASGLVEIHIQAQPNEKALEYYRNNMILMVLVPVDLSQCLSLDAPGAQIQNIGDSSAAVFTALPGEEGDYTVRIGSDSFETTGVILAMVPGTLKDLEHIQDLKEAKDTWEEAGDQFYDSLDQMAQAIEDMESGVSQALQGAKDAEGVRENWSAVRDEILAGNDQTLESLGKVSGQMEAMVPHLQTAKDAAETLHEYMGQAVDVLEEMDEPLSKLYTRLSHIQKHTDTLSGEIPQIRNLMLELVELDTQLQANEQLILSSQASLEEALELAEMEYTEEEDEQEEALPEEEPEDSEDSREIDRASASQARASLSPHQTPLVGAAMDQAQVLDTLSQKIALLTQLSEESGKLASTLSGLSEDLSEGAEYSKYLVDSLDVLLLDTVDLYHHLEEDYPDLQQSLTDSQTLVDQTAQALDSAVSTMTVLQNTLKETSPQLDQSLKNTLQGTMALLDQSLSVLDSTRSMRQAGRTMKEVLDQELDRYETENRFLFMDPSASKASFTSEKNQEPRTLQILVRTEEISKEDQEEKVLDAEIPQQSQGIWERICSVFRKMWEAVTGLFQ